MACLVYRDFDNLIFSALITKLKLEENFYNAPNAITHQNKNNDSKKPLDNTALYALKFVTVKNFFDFVFHIKIITVKARNLKQKR